VEAIQVFAEVLSIALVFPLYYLGTEIDPSRSLPLSDVLNKVKEQFKDMVFAKNSVSNITTEFLHNFNY
jgi:phenylalanyl-tRNA synthetase alpha subunit